MGSQKAPTETRASTAFDSRIDSAHRESRRKVARTNRFRHPHPTFDAIFVFAAGVGASLHGTAGLMSPTSLDSSFREGRAMRIGFTSPDRTKAVGIQWCGLTFHIIII